MHQVSDPTSRVFRLFVSSTFHDMGAERDHLVRAVFPQIRDAAWRRGVVFQEVDLRWGITAEEARRGEVIDLCLAEIDRCQPFFLALIGHRYGTHDTTAASDLPPHLADYAGRSVTELEIRHAAFRAESAGHPPGLAFIRTDADRDGDLASLIATLPELGFVCHSYDTPADLGDYLLCELEILLNIKWPEIEPDRNALTDVHLARLCHSAVPRSALDKRLRRAVAWNRRVVLHGSPGSGKSTALAQLAARPPRRRSIVFGSADLLTSGATWRDLVEQISEPKPAGPDQADTDLATRLASLQRAGGGIIILDELNRLWDGIGEPDLDWLDFIPPRGTGLLIATSRTDVVDSLRDDSWRIVDMPAMTRSERTATTHNYFAGYGKRLDPAESAELISAPAAALPATLRLMLDDLRVLGEFEKLSETVNHLGRVTSPDELARSLLERIRGQLVDAELKAFDHGLPAIALSRAGIAEADLLRFLSDGNDPIPFAHWRPISAALADHLALRDGRLVLTSTAVNKAVLALCAPQPLDRQAIRMQLADQAQNSADPDAATFEVPFQSALAGRLDRLDRFLADHQNREKIRREAPAELQRFVGLLSNTPHTETFARVKQEATGDDPDKVQAAAELLYVLGDPDGAEAALLNFGDDPDVLAALRLKALLGAAEFARRRGSLPAAHDALTRADTVATTFAETGTVALRLAALNLSEGALDAAEALLGKTDGASLPPGQHCEALRLCAQVALARSNHAQARKHARAARKVALKWAAFAEGAAATLTLAQIERQRGRFSAATRHLDEASRVFRRIGDVAGIAACHHDRTVLAMARGDYDTALSLLSAPMQDGEKAILGLAIRAELHRRLGAHTAAIRDLAELRTRLADLPSAVAVRLRRNMAEIATEIRVR